MPPLSNWLRTESNPLVAQKSGLARLRFSPYPDPMSQIPEEPEEGTRLLLAAADGDDQAADGLLPIVYDQLRKAAHREVADERRGITLAAMELIHEAYLKLIGSRKVAWANRVHLYGAAARAMRRILLDNARSPCNDWATGAP